MPARPAIQPPRRPTDLPALQGTAGNAAAVALVQRMKETDYFPGKEWSAEDGKYLSNENSGERRRIAIAEPAESAAQLDAILKNIGVQDLFKFIVLVRDHASQAASGVFAITSGGADRPPTALEYLTYLCRVAAASGLDAPGIKEAFKAVKGYTAAQLAQRAEASRREEEQQQRRRGDAEEAAGTAIGMAVDRAANAVALLSRAGKSSMPRRVSEALVFEVPKGAWLLKLALDVAEHPLDVGPEGVTEIRSGTSSRRWPRSPAAGASCRCRVRAPSCRSGSGSTRRSRILRR